MKWLLLLLLSTTVSAAELIRVEGPVKVNQGTAYVDAQAGMVLNSGDQLLVLRGGTADIAYPMCVYSVLQNEVYRVTDKSPCHAKSKNLPLQAGTVAVGLAAIAVGYTIADDDNDCCCPPISP